MRKADPTVIADMLFGANTFQPYNYTNLKQAKEDGHKVFDTSHWGYAFIEFTDHGIRARIKGSWDWREFTLKEFWDETKARKRQLTIIEQ